MKAFINGRRVFGTPMKGLPPEYPSEMVSFGNLDPIILYFIIFHYCYSKSCAQEYFFDPEVLTEGEVAPNDRCCRVCGKIGHFLKDCPMRNKWV